MHNKLQQLKVFILHGNMQYLEMWKGFGCQIVDNPLKADIVQFTGGADVSPSLYGEMPHYTTYSDPLRDGVEQQVYEDVVGNAFLAGVCRGGQFLNVMQGGKMIQDVDNHALFKGHGTLDHETGRVVFVTSTHHQMMVPGKDAYIVSSVPHTRCTRKMGCDANDVKYEHELYTPDIEVLFYPKDKVLCFQPHPEYSNMECRNYYKELLQRYV